MVEVSKGREGTILPETLILQEAVESFLSDALRIARVAVLFYAVTCMLLGFILNFMILTVKTGFK